MLPRERVSSVCWQSEKLCSFVSACVAQRKQISEKERTRRERKSSSFLHIRPSAGLTDGDTDVKEEQLFGALRCN